MIITPVVHELEGLLAKSLGPRSPGLHVSEIYGDLFQDLEPKRYSRDSAPNPIRLAVGLAWEAWLEQVLVKFDVMRPGELVSDEGIAYSPDLFVINGTNRIGEIKATWMSCASGLDDPKFDKWIVQAKIYCHWTDMKGARFYVLFMNGDYKLNREPTFKVWDVDFTERELLENHMMLMNHARHKGLL